MNDVQFCMVDWAGVVWRWGKIKIARTCCDCCDVGESAGKLCALCGIGCLTGLSSWGFVGWVNGLLYKRAVLIRDLFGN